ncbi:MAG: hypothetical protein WAM92_07015 [Mycobacterium sp.]
MASAPPPDDPIDEEIPVADAVEQRLEVGRTSSLSEDFEPTEVSEIASAIPPEDANPADWQEQHTTADDAEVWDEDIDR